jgi:hypothetical protein
MFFHWLLCFVYFFIAIWILSGEFPYPTCIFYSFCINPFLLLSNSWGIPIVGASLPAACAADSVKMTV